MWHASVITLFPELFPGPLAASLVGRALTRGDWRLDSVDLRDFGVGKHRAVDDRPAGGGPGMVLRPDSVTAAVDVALQRARRPIMALSPRGYPLTQRRVKQIAGNDGAILVCGRFEGIDQRALDQYNIEEISIGDFVLAGGEIAAMALIEACVRILPGVLGSADSISEESFTDNLLEYPHYTKPRRFAGQEIPSILSSGDHAKINHWRRERAIELTKARRPDMWQAHSGQSKTRG